MADESTTTLFSLRDKTVVITGGSRGLGLHAARAYVLGGAQRVYITSRKRTACEAAVRMLNALLPGGASAVAVAVAIPADLAREEEVRRLVDEVGRSSDRVDVLLANAGATWGERFDTHSDRAFGKVLDLNVRSVFNTIRLFTPLLEKRATIEDPSRVIVTASVAGLVVDSLGEHGTFGYAASKAAVIHLTKTLAVELGPRHILCNAIAPGFFPSKMANGLIDALGGPEKLAEASPNGRLGRAEDIAGAVTYLSSRAGSHVNGAVLTIDGGSHLARSSGSGSSRL